VAFGRYRYLTFLQLKIGRHPICYRRGVRRIVQATNSLEVGCPAERTRRGEPKNPFILGFGPGFVFQIKRIEKLPVSRGNVAWEELFEEKVRLCRKIPVSHSDDLFAGKKLVAALDRQAPRDLFDGQTALRAEGLDRRPVRAFLVLYLTCSTPPANESLAPNFVQTSG